MIQSILTGCKGMQVQASRVEACSRRVAGLDKPTRRSENPPLPEAADPLGLPAAESFLMDVDLGREIVTMKIAQKVYEANAKVVETSTEMLKRSIDVEV